MNLANAYTILPTLINGPNSLSDDSITATIIIIIIIIIRINSDNIFYNPNPRSLNLLLHRTRQCYKISLYQPLLIHHHHHHIHHHIYCHLHNFNPSGLNSLFDLEQKYYFISVCLLH